MRFTRFLLSCALVLCVLSLTSVAGFAKDIVLGMSAAFSGPSRSLGIELYRGSSAYFNYVNRSGGIQGHMVRILPLDDGYNPTPALENTIRLLKDRNVLCLYNYVGTPTVTRVLPLLNTGQARDKLMFFPFTGAQSQRDYPYVRRVFNLRASYRQEMQELVNRLSLVGRRRIAVLYQNDAYGRSGWDAVRRALRTHRLDIVGEATYRRGASFSDSMAEQVAIVTGRRPEAIVTVGSYEACAAFVRDARDAGVDVPIANLSFSCSESLLQLLLEAGQAKGRDYTANLINTQVVPDYRDRTLAAAQLYIQLMTESPPAVPEGLKGDYIPLEYSYAGFEGFLNAVVMTHILRLQYDRPGKPLEKIVEGIRDFDAGIDVTVTFGPDRHQGLNRVYFTTVKDGRFAPIDAEDWRQWLQ
ncbi:ABC transporter substrate-binding protein [Salidesulfovibrio onnuriiensis]|uniref:ABC transporter substrate-binding protein n=1 Tax=Salidesulfovibrio onnuriiensis TaxID=2583823 RepID=UPI0011CAAD0D|nr:ABC transporter substrate-binding protein [Salidesulfovibrio onnuriiensis]